MVTAMYHVVLFMVYADMMNEQYVLCDPLILVLLQLEKYTHERSLCYLKHQYQNFMKNNTLQQLKNCHLIFHMCVFLEQINVANNIVGNLNT